MPPRHRLLGCRLRRPPAGRAALRSAAVHGPHPDAAVADPAHLSHCRWHENAAASVRGRRGHNGCGVADGRGGHRPGSFPPETDRVPTATLPRVLPHGARPARRLPAASWPAEDEPADPQPVGQMMSPASAWCRVAGSRVRSRSCDPAGPHPAAAGQARESRRLLPGRRGSAAAGRDRPAGSRGSRQRAGCGGLPHPTAANRCLAQFVQPDQPAARLPPAQSAPSLAEAGPSLA